MYFIIIWMDQGSLDGCTEPGNFPDWTKILTSAGDMVQNVFNNDEWGLSVEIILGINSDTYVQRFWEQWRVFCSVEKQYLLPSNVSQCPATDSHKYFLVSTHVFTTNVYYNCHNLTVLSLPVKKPLCQDINGLLIVFYKWLVTGIKCE